MTVNSPVGETAATGAHPDATQVAGPPLPACSRTSGNPR